MNCVGQIYMCCYFEVTIVSKHTFYVGSRSTTVVLFDVGELDQ